MDLDEFVNRFRNRKVTLKNSTGPVITNTEPALMTNMQLVMLKKYGRSRGPGYVNARMMEVIGEVMPIDELTNAQANALLTILTQRDQ